MNIDDALPTFDAEAQELLDAMEQALLEIESSGATAEPINSIFRAVHTIKGSSGLFGFDDVVTFTHVLESVLDKLRDGSLPMDDVLPGLLLDGHDHISKLIRVAIDRSPMEAATASEGDALLARFRTYLNTTPTAVHVSPTGTPSGDRPIQSDSGPLGASAYWHISLRFGTDVLRNGMDPLSFLRYLQTLGEIMHITTLSEAMPAAADMDPESCYLGFEIAFDSSADKSTIEAAFEFVREDCQLRILPPHSRIEEYLRLIQELPEKEQQLGEILISCGALTRHELDSALRDQAVRNPSQPVGQIILERGSVSKPVIDGALEKQKQVRENRSNETRFIRVEADKLESLINLVGELVINSAGTALLARKHADAELLESTSTLSRLVEQVRDGALNLRMVQIGETFNRFHRIVRDVSKEIGKDITLVIGGGETELDKTVVERIGDPLTHLVRNAIDHGIEPAEIRAAAGKSPTGTVGLNAYHDSGTIVIEVTDDGGGLKRERLIAKALERGLIDSDQNLSDQEVYALIFEPGFSTADKVTNLSGRGVGMDVVKRNISALRGTVEIDSTPGAGTTIRIRLPLTLAIIDGFQVSVGKNHYVIPLDMVVECIELNSGDDKEEHAYIDLRGSILPYIRLARMFEIETDTSGGARRESIVVVQAGGAKAGLVVNQLLGEVQTVIKPLGSLFRGLRGIGGSAILGSGDVALILDVAQLLDMSARAHAHARTRGTPESAQ